MPFVAASPVDLLSPLRTLWATILFALISATYAFGQDPAAQAVELFNQGQEFHAKGDLKNAIDRYRRAVELIPEFPEAEYQSGHAYLLLGRPNEAEAAFRRAVELRGDWSLALAGLGSVLISNKKFDEAETYLTKALSMDEMNFPAFVSLVELRITIKTDKARLRKMLATAKELTAKASPTGSLWSARAALERTLGELPAARISISNALELEPNSVSIITEAITVALAGRDTTRAETLVARLLEREPSSENTKLQQAKLFAAKREFDRAAAVLRAISPSSGIAADLLGKVEIELAADPAELEKKLEGTPDDPSLLGRLCELNRRRDPHKALEYCRRAVQAEPDVIDHAIGFGAALVQSKRYDEAVAVLRNLKEFDSANATIRANLAAALFQLQRFAEAKVEYRWLLDNQPNLYTGYYFLAIVHDRLEEYPDAMANYQEFLKRADAVKDVEEIERTKLRLPTLQRQISQKRGAKRD